MSMPTHRPSCSRSRTLIGLLGFAIGCGTAAGQPCNQFEGTGWDGITWIRTLEWLDVGDGAQVYAGQHGVWAFGGSSWIEVGDLAGPVLALEAFDDGSGPALYAGRDMRHPPVKSKVWRFDGVEWHNLDVGGEGAVHAMKVFDDGTGPALYAAGKFTSIGGVEARNIARWNGTTWSALGGGVGKEGGGGTVRALQVFDDGTGPALYAGGNFDQAGTVAANHVAAWDGNTWRPLAGGIPLPTNTLTVFDAGAGESLYATPFAYGLWQWDGAEWIDVDPDPKAFNVTAAAVHDDGRGPALFLVGRTLQWPDPDGYLGLVGGPLRWDGSSWELWPHLGIHHINAGWAILSAGDGSMYVAVKMLMHNHDCAPWSWYHGVIRYDCGIVRCDADLNCDGVLDVTDVALFIDQFTNGGWDADFNGDGVVNFFDLSAYLAAFSAGCP